MDAVRNRLRAGASWLPSSASFRNFTLFDALSVPFTDSQMESGRARSLSPSTASEGAARMVFLDEHGREISEAEMQSINFGDSPWGFIASRYAITLAVMAVLVNRITHICRPQGRPRPLPLSRRLAIQLPTTLTLFSAAVWLAFITLRSFQPQLSLFAKLAKLPGLPWMVRDLLSDATSLEDASRANAALLWHLFIFVCLSVVSSTFLRTLEGHTTVVDDLGNSPTFNLVGFAVMLHLNASSNVYKPNKHVYLSILLQVCEVFGLQSCTCWTRPPVSRLTLTSIIGVISSIHYVIATVKGDGGYPYLQSYSHAPDVAIITIIALTLSLHALTAFVTSTPLSFSRLIDPRSMPLPSDDYSMALIKLGTACLNSTRLSGLDSDLVDIRTNPEPWLEIDGAQVIVRSSSGAVARLDQMTDGGFNNEIRRVKSNKVVGDRHFFFRAPLWRQRWQFIRALMSTIRGVVLVVTGMILGLLPFSIPRPGMPAWARRVPRRIRLLWHGTNGEERRRQRLEREQQLREALQSSAETARARQAHSEGAGRALASPSDATASFRAEVGEQGGLRRRMQLRGDFTPQPNSWHYFFDQEFAEDDDDDEDEEWREGDARILSRHTSPTPLDPQTTYWSGVGQGSRLGDLAEDEEEEDEWNDEDDDADAEEAAEMSTELLALARRDDGGLDGSSGEESDDESNEYTRVLMAHLARSQRGKVLTRSAYKKMIAHNAGAAGEIESLSRLIQERRPPGAAQMVARGNADDAERERMRLCVICYIEDRTIICWPCKCLALCDGCREAMASRPPPRHVGDRAGGANYNRGNVPTHTCPTCRTPVIGFSRIFMP